MSDKTEIQWTEATWNVATGCTKCSPGCANCYIERTPPFRMHGRKFVRGTTGIVLHQDRLSIPLHWNKPKRIFVNSLSDLFHDDIPDDFIDQIFAVMALCPQHTFQCLTKRHRRMFEWFNRKPPFPKSVGEQNVGERIEAMRGSIEDAPYHVPPFPGWPLPNVWLGVSVENQHFAAERIPILLKTPAVVRWISAEPLLGPVDLDTEGKDGLHALGCGDSSHKNLYEHCNGLDWVVCGGESGPRARPLRMQWARALMEQCKESGVPFFMKQLGVTPISDRKETDDWSPLFRDSAKQKPTGEFGFLFSLGKNGDPEDWPMDLQVREWPKTL